MAGLLEIAARELQAGRNAQARASFDEAIAIRQKLMQANESDVQLRRELAATYDRIAAEQRQAGRPAHALATYQTSLAIRQKLAEQHPEISRIRLDLASTHSGIGALLWQTGQPIRAMESNRAALEIIRSLVQSHPADYRFRRELADIHFRIGLLEWKMGRPAEAIDSCQAALAIERKVVDDKPAETGPRSLLASMHMKIGMMRAASGMLAEAISEYQKAESIYRSLAGSNRDSPMAQHGRSGLADAQTHSADVYRAFGRISEARAGYDRAIAMLEGLIKADSEGSENEGYRRMLGHTLRGLGLRHAPGDNAGAVAATRRALELHEGLPEEWSDPYELACIRAELAGLASQPGSGIPPAQAESLADEAVGLLFKAVAQSKLRALEIRMEAALDPIRARGDFKLLMMDLAIPIEPFTR